MTDELYVDMKKIIHEAAEYLNTSGLPNYILLGWFDEDMLSDGSSGNLMMITPAANKDITPDMIASVASAMIVTVVAENGTRGQLVSILGPAFLSNLGNKLSGMTMKALRAILEKEVESEKTLSKAQKVVRVSAMLNTLLAALLKEHEQDSGENIH